MDNSSHGLGLHLGNLSHLSHAQSRSVSADNFNGEKGGGGRGTGVNYAQFHRVNPLLPKKI